MADEKEVTPKPEKKAEALAPPFVIRRKVVLNDEVYQPGDEEKLRPKLDAANFKALCEQRAIARLEPREPRK